MISARNMILDVVQEISPANAPKFFWSVIFPAVHWLHRTWFWVKRVDAYRDADLRQAGFLLGGVALQFTLGQNEFLKASAKIADLSLRILDVSQDYTKMVRLSNDLDLVWASETKIAPIDVQWLEPIPLISWSLLNKIHTKQSDLVSRIKKTMLIILRILEQVFIMSMHLMDAIQAFEGHFLQVVEMPENVYKLSERLYKGELSERESLVDKVISYVAPGNTFRTLQENYFNPSSSKEKSNGSPKKKSPVKGKAPATPPPSPNSKVYPASSFDVFSSMPSHLSARIVQAFSSSKPKGGEWTQKIEAFRKKEPFIAAAFNSKIGY